MASLAEFHSLLISHFIRLGEKRREVGFPTFALEHPLSESQVEELKSAVRERQPRKPRIQEWMAWVVYSTELGYDFEGREYWESFEEVTPSWTPADRTFIRDCFARFVEKFNGYQPTGPWATQFSIIAYPITHSVIPRDLQREFAKVLYDLRYYLSANSIHIPDQLGRRIADVSFDTSNRFQQLAQNTALVGSVAMQLLAPTDSELEQLLEPPTLARIVRDIRRHRDAARWLDEARTHAKRTSSERQISEDSPGRQLVELPVLYLQRGGVDCWDVWIEIPNLSNLWDVEPEVFRFLQTNRVQIRGSAVKEKLAPATISTFGPTRRRLGSLPPTDAGILAASAELPARVKDFFNKFRPADNKLVFKVREDGRAVRIGSATVSASEKYLYFTASKPPFDSCRQVQTNISDIALFEFTIPENPSLEAERFLSGLGLKVNADDSLQVQGIGSVPYYSEPGAIAFFEDETPLLAIASSLAIRIQVIDDDCSLFVKLTPGERSFIGFESAPPGVRTLRMLATENGGLELTRVRIITLPRGSRNNLSTRSPFALITNPFAPTLDSVLRGHAQFDLFAPDGTEIQVFISLPSDEADSEVEKELLRFRTPVEALGLKIAESIEKLDRRLAARVDDSFKCTLRFTAESLGNIEIGCNREALPVRLRVVTDGARRVLRLANYSDDAQNIKVRLYPLATPDKPICLPEFELGYTEKILADETGMFVASGSGGSTGLIVFPQPAPGRVIRDFGELVRGQETDISITQQRNSQSDFLRLLELYWLWATSRHVGDPLSLVQLKSLKEALRCELISCVGGTPNWRRCETRYNRGTQTKRGLLEAVTVRRSLQEDLKSLSEKKVREVQDLIPLLTGVLLQDVADHTTRAGNTGGIQVLKVVRRIWFVEFALRLATAPETLPGWAGKRLPLAVSVMFEKPILPRAARYIYLIQRNSSIDWRWRD